MGFEVPPNLNHSMVLRSLGPHRSNFHGLSSRSCLISSPFGFYRCKNLQSAVGTSQQLPGEIKDPGAMRGCTRTGTLRSVPEQNIPRSSERGCCPVPPRSSFQGSRRTPGLSDTTSSNAPSEARGAAPGWAGSRQPGQGAGRGAKPASPESIAGEARPELRRKAGQESTFMGLLTAALGGRKFAGKSALAELLLLAGGSTPGAGSPRDRQGLVPAHLLSKLTLGKKRKTTETLPNPKCPSSCHGTGIST